jgi:hypothetical protein
MYIAAGRRVGMHHCQNRFFGASYLITAKASQMTCHTNSYTEFDCFKGPRNLMSKSTSQIGGALAEIGSHIDTKGRVPVGLQKPDCDRTVPTIVQPSEFKLHKIQKQLFTVKLGCDAKDDHKIKLVDV